MKAIYYFVFLSLLSCTVARAQLDGRKFVSGSISTNFNAVSPKTGNNTNNYSFGINLGLGKFKSNTRAGEWSIFSNLSGSKQLFYLPNDSLTRSGINGFGIGTGYAWSFYKHFGEKFGIFGGPGITARYQFAKQIQANGEQLADQKSNDITASLNISAGAYYVLNHRWWLTASLAFSNPVNLTYASSQTEIIKTGTTYKTSGVQYELTPAFSFPSVSLGLRYFLKD